MPHVEKRNGRWRARYRGPDGKERSQTFDRKTDATDWLNDIEQAKRKGTWIDPNLGKVTLTEWVERLAATNVDLRKTTIARDESYLRTHITPVFGKRAIASIEHMEIREWVAKLTSSGKAPATVNKAHQILSKTLRQAVEVGIITVNPADGVPLPRIETAEMRFLTPEEIIALADAIHPRYRGLVIFDSYCGLRMGEIAGLRRDRVDLLRRGDAKVRVSEIAVEVQGHLSFGHPKTRAGRRTVPILSDIAVQALVDHLDAYTEAPADALVFSGRNGCPLRVNGWRARFWKPAIKKAGVDPLRPHDMRHTAVSLWIAAGASPKQIATWAGHTSVSVVLDRYGHLFPGNEDPVRARLNAIAAAAQAAASADVVQLPAASSRPAAS